nr:hypothetical protein JVH1_4872 [Rhodococcus sp. JVH1]
MDSAGGSLRHRSADFAPIVPRQEWVNSASVVSRAAARTCQRGVGRGGVVDDHKLAGAEVRQRPGGGSD